MILGKIDRWLKRMFGSAELRPYEAACLDEWKKQLSEKPRLLLESQLSRFDYVARLANDKQVVFWCLKEQYARCSQELRFPAAMQEEQTVEVASIWLRGRDPRSQARLRADMIVADGELLWMEFDKPPLAYFGPGKEGSEEPVVDEVAIRHDLVHESPSVRPLTDTGGLKGWLAEWDSRWQLSEVLEPQSEEHRQGLLRGFDTVFPDDYLEALAQVGGFRIRNCKVFGLPGVQKVVHPDQNYYVFAEIVARAYIGVVQGAKTVEIHWLDQEFDTEPLESISIRDVLTRELQAEEY